MNSSVRAVIESQDYKQMIMCAELVSQHNRWEKGLKLPSKNRWYLSSNGICVVQLHGGYYTIVDEDDMILFEDRCYHAHISDSSIYTKDRNGTYLHRLIAQRAYGNIPIKKEVDHINGCSLDNRRSNLRIVTRSENQKNGKKRVDNRSGVAGVCWQKGNGKWRARINSQGIYIDLGCYDTLEEAKSARLEAEAKSGSLYRCNSNN